MEFDELLELKKLGSEFKTKNILTQRIDIRHYNWILNK